MIIIAASANAHFNIVHNHSDSAVAKQQPNHAPIMILAQRMILESMCSRCSSIYARMPPAISPAMPNNTARILTCFLEYDADTVMAHDILNERDGLEWRQRVSAYRKLRLSPDWVAGTLEANGLNVRIEQGLAGMVRLIATRPL